MNYSGFVCEIGPDSFKIYDFVHQLVEIDNKDADGLKSIALGLWFDNGELSKKNVLKIDVIDDVVTLETAALRPNVAALPDARLREKYRDVVWSPWFQNLHDPKKLFYLWRAEDPVMATVKYAPSGNLLFEVILLDPKVDIELIPANFTDAPWHVETRMDYIRMPTLDDNLPRLPENQRRTIDRSMSHLGICVKLHYDNPSGNRYNRGGRTKVMHYVYSFELGLVRSIPENRMELGKWYSFNVNDSRKLAKANMGTPTHFASITCRRVTLESCAPLVSRAVDGNVQIDTDYIFCKTEGNRQVHFVDPQLGKVEIKSAVSRAIFQKIESRSPEDIEKRKADDLVVLVRVGLHPMWYVNYTNDPMSAVFEVTELVDIRYFSDGASIMDGV